MQIQLALKSIKAGFLHKPIVHLLLIIIVGFIAYSNTFDVPFYFDDEVGISGNPLIKDLRFFLAPSTAKEYNQFGQYDALKMRYVGFLTFAMNYKLHGLDVTGYHIFNISVHIINALLVYWLVVLTFKTPYFEVSVISVSEQTQKTDTVHYSPIHLFTYLPLFIALFSALLFVCHPIQTQAVTYISQRFASLAAMFYLLSIVMYIKARLGQNTEHRIQNTDNKTSCHSCKSRNPETKDWIPVSTGMTNMSGKRLHKIFSLYSVLWYLGSVFSAILAMKTKEIAFTLPFVIALYEFMFFKEKFKKRILYLAPILLTMLIIPLSLIEMDKSLGDLLGDINKTTKVSTEMSRWDYLFTQFRVIVTYIRLIFLPINQNLDYDYPIYRSLFTPSVFLSFLLLLSIFGLGIYLLYRSRFTACPALRSEAGVHSSPTPNSELLTPNSRLVSFGIFWFFITLSVESSIIPIADVIFEHRLYLPSIGAIIAITSLVFTVHSSWFRAYKRWNAIAIVLFGLITVVFAGAAYQRNTVWQNEVSLWEDIVRKSPNKARGHNNLGAAYDKKECWMRLFKNSR